MLPDAGRGSGGAIRGALHNVRKMFLYRALFLDSSVTDPGFYNSFDNI
jgi:hypothetical protein